jgi:glycerophosphoryl diester phosphodiesterase
MSGGKPSSAHSFVPVDVKAAGGRIRLKWHKLRTHRQQAPFKLSNLAVGWKLGASLEVDILAAADGRFVVLHDPTLGPSTTGRGRVGSMTYGEMAGLYHRDEQGTADTDAPVLSLCDFMARLRQLKRAPGANLQLDLKVLEGRPLPESAIRDAATAVAGLEHSIVIGSHYLDEAHRLVDAMPGARLGYDPMLAAAREPDLMRKPERMLRHMERRQTGVTLAYLQSDALIAAESGGFPLTRRLLDLGIETDAWTVNPGPTTTDAMLSTLAEAGVRQITTDAPAEIAAHMRHIHRHPEGKET